MTYVEIREHIQQVVAEQGKGMVKVEAVDAVIKALQEIAMKEVSENGKFVIPGFITLNSIDKKAQTGVAFAGTDKEINWSKPAHKTVTIKLSPSFKTAYELKNNPNLAISKDTQE